MIGTVIKEQYRIVELMGEGGMGSVYKALDEELGRYVALKFLRADLADNSALLMRFRDELRTLAGFNHPNITTLFTSVTWQEHPVMVMELLEGETLQKMVDRRGPIPADVCIPLVTQALAGVGAAHRKKIIHRDLKPANLMLTVDGVVKVMDFGIAKMQDGPSVTRSNVAVGTSLYMAPEQILGSGADARTDIYAIGVTLYELLAGRVPFVGDSQYAIEHAHIQQMPELPTVYYPHIPQYAVNAVMKALAKDRAARFQSAEEFSVALCEPRSAFAAAAQQTGGNPNVNTPPVWQATPVITSPPPPSIPTPAPTQAKESFAEPVWPDPVPEKPAIAAAPSKVARGKLLGVGLVAATVSALAIGGWWMASPAKQVSKLEGEIAPGSFTGGGGAGGGGTVKKEDLAPAVGKDEPSVTPTSPAIDLSTLTKRDEPARSVPTPQNQPEENSSHGVSGQWTGSYERCEDNARTKATLKLHEPSPGQIAGTIRFSTPEGQSGACALSGIVSEPTVTLTASDCSGVTPPFLTRGYKSLLTMSGNEMSGNIEPDSLCMAISLLKSGR